MNLRQSTDRVHVYDATLNTLLARCTRYEFVSGIEEVPDTARALTAVAWSTAPEALRVLQ